MEKKRNAIIFITIHIILILIALLFAKINFGPEDFISYIKWYLMLLFMTITGLPLLSILFNNYYDKGYIFSKVIGIILSSFLMWLLSSLHLLKFSITNSIICTFIILIISIVLTNKNNNKKELKELLPIILKYESIFFLLFTIVCYIKGFNPAAYSTEKFMDFGYMSIMYKTDYMPSIDLWFSGKIINYYYFGQYISTFLTKVATLKVNYGYNLMLVTLFSITFFESFSIVYNLLKLPNNNNKKYLPLIGGLIAALSNTIAGNIHYVIFCKIIPLISKINNIPIEKEYYFPDSTRYIGYNPDTVDKTIHEFPSYALVLGDLHAHVINMIFVLLLLALLLSYIIKKKKKEQNNKIINFITPTTILLGFLLGIYKMTNYWDFIIYIVVVSLIFIFTNITTYKNLKDIFKSTITELIVIAVTSTITSIPFIIKFTKMASKVKFVPYRTPLYQLLILWGLPILLFIVYFIITIIKSLKIKLKKNKIINYIFSLNTSDLYIIILEFCAIGLIIIPEIVYVVDIYLGNLRANTMFKLTYQSYIMFSIAFGYILTKMTTEKKLPTKIIGYIFLVIFISTLGYIKAATKDWFGDITNHDNYKSLDATAFLSNSIIEDDINMLDDYSMINWLNKNASNNEVILETYGDSYTFDNRISTFTGLATPLGWSAHEWLWRSDGINLDMPEEVSKRMDDVDTLYKSKDINELNTLINKYKISYIIIGYNERKRHSNGIALENEEILKKLGDIVYLTNKNNKENPMYIIKINNIKKTYN